ncbi:MAG: hypothetical protein ACLBM4_15080 [Dolichospermum sp.]
MALAISGGYRVSTTLNYRDLFRLSCLRGVAPVTCSLFPMKMGIL